MWLRGPEASCVIGGSEDDELFFDRGVRGPGVSAALGKGRRTL